MKVNGEDAGVNASHLRGRPAFRQPHLPPPAPPASRPPTGCSVGSQLGGPPPGSSLRATSPVSRPLFAPSPIGLCEPQASAVNLGRRGEEEGFLVNGSSL